MIFKKIFFSIVISSLFFCPVFADDALKEIDALIEMREYNLALSLITKYMRENPKKFDEAEKRVQEIFSARKQYSRKADDFIEVLLDEPENDKKKLDMIKDLEETEKNPGKAEKEFVAEAKKAAQFAYFRSQYARMQRESRAFMDDGKYGSAANVFEKGFDIYRNEFFANDENGDISETLSALLKKVEDDCTLFSLVQVDLKSAYERYIAALKSGKYSESEKAFKAVDSAFSRAAVIHNDILSCADEMKNCYSTFVKDFPDLTDAAYIAFVSRLALGSEGVAESGIVRVIETQWKALVSSMDSEAYLATLKNSDEMCKSENESFEAIKSQCENVRLFSRISVSTNDLNKKMKKSSGGTFFDDNEKYSRSLLAAEKWASRCEGLSSAKRAFEDEDLAIERLSDTSNAAKNERENKRDAVSKMIDSLDVYKNYRDRFSDDAPYLEDLKVENCALEWNDAIPYHDSLMKAVGERYAQSTVKLWHKLGNYFVVASNDIAKDDGERVESAISLLGATEDDLHYSRESVPKFEEAQKRISADIGVLRSELGVLENGAEENVLEYKNTISANIDYLSSLLFKASENLGTAKNNVVLSEKAKDEAERRYQQASASFSKNDFESARNSIAKARAKFNESLSYQEDPALRKRSDDILGALSLEIARAENVFIVREVRELITKARREYYNGEFESAESLLIRARDRWAITNIEEHPEIHSMLSLVNNALELKNGRELRVSAPLYPEMSQILNIAKKHFAEGQKNLKKNKRDKALQYFEKALQKLHELQLVYPLNREASVLTLRIAQISDPAEFEKLFASRIDTAKVQIKQKEMRQQAYADLQDLYEINPSYPGLKDLIFNVEIEIGIRQKPVSREEKARASAMTERARKLIDSAGSDAEKLKSALSLLNEASSLNADSAETAKLIDSVQTRVGGNAVLVLSGEDEAKYQKAVQALQKNNVIMAKALVEQLLKKDSNRNSAKILELQKRVNALL